MKRHILLATVPALAIAAALIAGCNRHDRDQIADNTADAYHDTKSAVKDSYNNAKSSMKDTWNNIRDYSYEKRDDLEDALKSEKRSFDARVSQLRADYSESKASASRREAMNELKDSEANFQEKMSALGNATADTWDAAKQNVIAAWDRLQAAYAKARSEAS